MWLKRLLSSLNWVIGTNLIAGTANLMAGIWFARFLGPAVMGEYAAVVTVLYLLTALMVPGFNQAIIREPERREVVAAAVVATIVQSVLVVVAGGTAYGVFYVWWPQDVSSLFVPGAILLLSLILSFFLNLFAAPFEAGMDYAFLMRVRLIGVTIGIVSGVTVAKNGLGIYALVVRDLLTTIVMLVLIGFRSPLTLSWHGWHQGMAALLKFAGGLWGLNALDKLAPRIDHALVGMLFGKELFGVYFVVRGIVEGLLGFVVTPIQTVVYSFYCRVKELPSFSLLSPKRLTMFVSGTIIVTGVAYLTGPMVIQSLLGQAYQQGQLLLVGLLVYASAAVWFENIKAMALSQAVHHRLLVPKVIHVLVSIVVLYPCVKVAGFMGAAIASGMAAVFAAALATRLANQWRVGEGDRLPMSIVPSQPANP